MTAPLLLLWLALPAASHAQNAYEIQVYGSRTADIGSTFAELHSNTAAKGPPNGPGGLQPDEGAYHETSEITRKRAGMSIPRKSTSDISVIHMPRSMRMTDISDMHLILAAWRPKDPQIINRSLGLFFNGPIGP